jgi:hypothetical protein
MADTSEFTIAGKRNLKVRRTGKKGEGNIIRVVLTILPRKRQPQWRGLHLDLVQNKAEWRSFGSQTRADAWANLAMEISEIG